MLQTHGPYILVIYTDSEAVSFFSHSVSSLLNDIQSRTNRRFNFIGMYKVLKGIQHLKSTYSWKQSELDEKS